MQYKIKYIIYCEIIKQIWLRLLNHIYMYCKISTTILKDNNIT